LKYPEVPELVHVIDFEVQEFQLSPPLGEVTVIVPAIELEEKMQMKEAINRRIAFFFKNVYIRFV
jgi:hypothetical protein